jgi:hypothetical protein
MPSRCRSTSTRAPQSSMRAWNQKAVRWCTCEELQDWPLASNERQTGERSRPPILTVADLQEGGLAQASTIQVQHDGACHSLIHADWVLAAARAANRWLMLTTAASRRRGVDVG